MMMTLEKLQINLRFQNQEHRTPLCSRTDGTEEENADDIIDTDLDDVVV